MRRVLVLLVVAGCIHTPSVPRAVVTPYVDAGAAGNQILVVPSTCQSVDPGMCELDRSENQAIGRPGGSRPLDNYLGPLLRLKLQLAGYALTDAKTLKLQSSERTDTDNVESNGDLVDAQSSSNVTSVPTVAELSPDQRFEVARVLGLTGVLRSTVTVTHPSFTSPVKVELVVELVDAQTEKPLWNVTCYDDYESWGGTLDVLANCVGDGLLAWRAPDAINKRRLP